MEEGGSDAPKCIKRCFALARFLHDMHQMIMCNAPRSQKVHHSLWSWTCYASIPPIEATLVYKHASIWRVWNTMLHEVHLRRSKSWSFFMTVILSHYATCPMYLFRKQFDVFDGSDFLHGSIPPPRGHASVAAPVWHVRLLQPSWFQTNNWLKKKQITKQNSRLYRL